MTNQIRCAVYTRKSTEEGLEQEFNSLDAQREAAEAYIKSQRHEGWICLPTRYDDGGFSGGNIERPSLTRLLSDVESGGVDCVVVYKVDRLSRSLLDFAQIVQVFEKNNVSFVSVTQQFNTTSSMGRLTLNVLLSFAQFEREIIAERTRDKMRASRRKGKWTGGLPVLGYDVAPEGGRLLVNESEAKQVREIYRLYLKLQTLSVLADELNRRGLRTKSWITKKGRLREGGQWTKVRLSRILTNVSYLGKVNHRGTIYEGEHTAILDDQTFYKVQQLLSQNRNHGGALQRNKHGALLKDMIYCGQCGEKFVHNYAKKGDRLYRYYVCASKLNGQKDKCDGPRIPVGELDRFVVEQIKDIGKRPEVVSGTMAAVGDEFQMKVPALESEREVLTRDLRKLKKESKQLLAVLAETGRASPTITERLAEVDARAERIENRLGEIQEELLDIHSRSVNHEEVSAALSIFDPVWDALYPKEQIRVLRLLIDRIDFDGSAGKMDISFRPLGIKLLAKELQGGKEAEWVKPSK